MSGHKPNRGSFAAGQSGNPGGRPQAAEIAAIARRYTPDAIRALVAVCRGSDSASARVSAALGLLDRGWGKPRQELELSGGMGQALHLHLYAVQRLEQARAVADTLEAPPIEGTAAEFSDALLPRIDETPPHEALPLWDAARERDAEPDPPEGASPGVPPPPESPP